jgi:hypothetical protein
MQQKIRGCKLNKKSKRIKLQSENKGRGGGVDRFETYTRSRL